MSRNNFIICKRVRLTPTCILVVRISGIQASPAFGESGHTRSVAKCYLLLFKKKGRHLKKKVSTYDTQVLG